MSKDRAPIIKEQYKDNAVEVEKNIAAAAQLRRSEVQHKEAEFASNPKKNEDWDGSGA